MAFSYYDLHSLQTPNITDRAFQCPHKGCGRLLKLNLCATGKNAGRYFLKCFSPGHSTAFWHFFPAGQHPHQNEASRLLVNAARRPQLALASSSDAKCAHSGCHDSRVNRKCDQGKCKKHCGASGGCRCHPPPTQPVTLPALSGPSLAAFDSIKEYANFIPRYIQQLEDERLKLQNATATPSPTLSQEEEDFCYAQLLSIGFDDSDTPTGGSSSGNDLDLAQAAEETFLLVNWPRNNEPAVVEGVQNCPKWPYWTRGGNTPYECFSPAYSTWMRVLPSYAHRLSTGQPLFVRAIGVKGSDEDEQLRRFLPVLDAEPAERGILPRIASASAPSHHVDGKRKRAAKRTVEVIELESDGDEVIIVGERVDGHKIKQEPPSPRRIKRRHLQITIPEAVSTPSSSTPSSSTPSLSYSSTPTTSAACPSTSPLPSPMTPYLPPPPLRSSPDFPYYLTK
ncbi:hypothetical protein DFH09DRAFT_1208794 [Mycena vulgaris]|nr:hypothetical protein DFH09DRAFT_1208794 [Mycena vulgaris]